MTDTENGPKTDYQPSKDELEDVFPDPEDSYCERCYNTGELDCYCGGDLCVCDRHGTYPCPDCSR